MINKQLRRKTIFTNACSCVVENFLLFAPQTDLYWFGEFFLLYFVFKNYVLFRKYDHNFGKTNKTTR